MQTWLSPFSRKIPFIILNAFEYHNTDEEGLPKILVKSANFPEKNEPLFSHQMIVILSPSMAWPAQSAGNKGSPEFLLGKCKGRDGHPSGGLRAPHVPFPSRKR
jgi:hypothetical protein